MKTRSRIHNQTLKPWHLLPVSVASPSCRIACLFVAPVLDFGRWCSLSRCCFFCWWWSFAETCWVFLFLDPHVTFHAAFWSPFCLSTGSLSRWLPGYLCMTSAWIKLLSCLVFLHRERSRKLADQSRHFILPSSKQFKPKCLAYESNNDGGIEVPLWLFLPMWWTNRCCSCCFSQSNMSLSH